MEPGHAYHKLDIPGEILPNLRWPWRPGLDIDRCPSALQEGSALLPAGRYNVDAGLMWCLCAERCEWLKIFEEWESSLKWRMDECQCLGSRIGLAKIDSRPEFYRPKGKNWTHVQPRSILCGCQIVLISGCVHSFSIVGRCIYEWMSLDSSKMCVGTSDVWAKDLTYYHLPRRASCCVITWWRTRQNHVRIRQNARTLGASSQGCLQEVPDCLPEERSRLLRYQTCPSEDQGRANSRLIPTHCWSITWLTDISSSYDTARHWRTNQRETKKTQKIVKARNSTHLQIRLRSSSLLVSQLTLPHTSWSWTSSPSYKTTSSLPRLPTSLRPIC